MMKPIEEIRYYKPDELRATIADGKPPMVGGLAVPYEQLSADLGGFREKIAPGAFRATLEGGGDVRADVEHQRAVKLARRSKGSLRLADSPAGVSAEIDLPDTTVGRDTLEEVRGGLLDGMSIGFLVNAEDFSVEDGETVRTVTDAVLTAVTLTQFPAYPQTSGTVDIRSLEAWRTQQNTDETAEKEAERVRNSNKRGRELDHPELKTLDAG